MFEQLRKEEEETKCESLIGRRRRRKYFKRLSEESQKTKLKNLIIQDIKCRRM
jgi:hypothetical protein